MAKIKLDLDHTTPAEQLTYGTSVIDDSSTNPNFTTISALILAFTAQHYDYGLLVAQVADLEGQIVDAIIARDAAQPGFQQAFSALASGAEGVAVGDPVKLSGGGWALQPARQAPQPLPKVLNLSLTTGESAGELDGHWDRLTHASGYEAQKTTTPSDAASWVALPIPMPTRSQNTFTGLPSGTRLWVRVRGQGGTEGTGPWSDPASGMVP